MSSNNACSNALKLLVAAYGDSSDEEIIAKVESSDDSDDSDSSSDDSDLQISYVKIDKKQYRQVDAIIDSASDNEEDVNLDSDGDGSCDAPGNYNVPRTKNEVLPVDLPLNNDICKVPCPEKGQLRQLGKVAYILEAEKLVVIEAYRDELVLNEGTLLFSEDGQALGPVFETIGPVSRPYYTVRLPSEPSEGTCNASQRTGRSKDGPGRKHRKQHQPSSTTTALATEIKDEPSQPIPDGNIDDVQMRTATEEPEIKAEVCISTTDQAEAEQLKSADETTPILEKADQVQSEQTVICVDEAIANMNTTDQDQTQMEQTVKSAVERSVVDSANQAQPELAVKSEDKPSVKVERGMTVWYAPFITECTRIVFATQLLQLKGSDASWEHDEEPPAHALDYSDDEAERRARAKLRGRGRNEAEGDDDSSDEAPEINTHTEDNEECDTPNRGRSRGRGRGRGRSNGRARGGAVPRIEEDVGNPFALPNGCQRGRGRARGQRGRGRFTDTGNRGSPTSAMQFAGTGRGHMDDFSHTNVNVHRIPIDPRFGTPSSFGIGQAQYSLPPAVDHWNASCAYMNGGAYPGYAVNSFGSAERSMVTLPSINAQVQIGAHQSTNGYDSSNYTSARSLRNSLGSMPQRLNTAEGAPVDMRFVENADVLHH